MPPKGPSPKTVAEALTAHFLEAGSFVASGGGMGSQPIASNALQAIGSQALGFAGLAVESVGYSVGPGPGDANPGVHIYVSRGTQKFLKQLPKEISGVPCTVHNIGRLSVKPELSDRVTVQGQLYERKGAIACGSSCAPSGRSYSGTLGALVRKNRSGTLYALSNNHVLADCNHVGIGHPILSPSGQDARPHGRPPAQICVHSDIVELRSGAPALVTPCREDLAIAEVPETGLVSSWQGDEEGGYDTPTEAATLTTGLQVQKWGRTTGLTQGIMESVQVRTSVPYEGKNFRALVWFKDVWSIRSVDGEPFALPGDSGSLVVTGDGKKAVGILFAIASKGLTGFLVPMETVLKAFGGITLVGQHNV